MDTKRPISLESNDIADPVFDSDCLLVHIVRSATTGDLPNGTMKFYKKGALTEVQHTLQNRIL